MWDNIGSRLQTVAKVICWIGIIASVISGIVAITGGRNGASFITGLLTIVVGCLVSWIGSWAMYGLGLVVEKVENSGSLVGSSTQNTPGSVSWNLVPDEGWECPKCHTRNFLSKDECMSCGTMRKSS